MRAMTARWASMRRRRIVIVAFPDVQALDVAGPAEVFAQAGGYDVQVAAPDA